MPATSTNFSFEALKCLSLIGSCPPIGATTLLGDDCRKNCKLQLQLLPTTAVARPVKSHGLLNSHFQIYSKPPQQQQQQPSSKMKTCPELTYEVDPKVMVFALKFLNSAPKEKLILELELTETIANKVIDQRDFGGYKNLDDVFDKKLMRKK
ncbi:hypothetical protein As57867_004223, partial [Aphanomyces stellatus]